MLWIAILASLVAFLDGSVVNVALPAISRELGGGLTTQQWVVDAYLITLGACILIAGSFSDLFGRQRILQLGLLGFGATSLLCAVAPSAPLLIFARALQGIAGALLVPSSLAIIIATFSGAAQAKAIGSWTAWTGIAFLVGPILGGAMVDLGSWRWVFAINVIPIAIVLWLLHILAAPDQVREDASIDVLGAVLCMIGLGLPVYGLIEQPHYGWASPLIYGSLALGIVAFAAFLVVERHRPNAMLPLELFKIRNFWAGNLATTSIYAGLSALTFLLAIYLQQVVGYKATAAGVALLPITIIMFFLSPRFGALAGKYGPRLFMGVGPILGAVGATLFLRLNAQMHYLSDLLPGVLIFGLGLSITVAPLTAAILGAIDSKHAGIGSAVNNAVARIAGLIAVAVIGLLAGANLTTAGFKRAMTLTVLLLLVGGLISLIGIKNPKPENN